MAENGTRENQAEMVSRVTGLCECYANSFSQNGNQSEEEKA